MSQSVSTANYLCIGCPMGCRLEVDTAEEDRIVEIRGFSCKRGKEYAAQEHVDPRRNVALTVGLRGGALPRLPVKTSAAVPKARVLALCAALRDLVVDAPVRVGQVVAVNPLGLGVDIVATREMGGGSADGLHLPGGAHLPSTAAGDQMDPTWKVGPI